MKITQRFFWLPLAAILIFSLGACAGGNSKAATSLDIQTQSIVQTEVDVSYTLKTSSGAHGLVFMGSGGDIDGVVNPSLIAQPGDTVEITLINGDGMLHDLTIDEFGVTTGEITEKGIKKTVRFAVDEAGSYVYYCAIPGHRQAGMFGTLQVGEPTVNTTVGKDIVSILAPVS